MALLHPGRMAENRGRAPVFGTPEQSRMNAGKQGRGRFPDPRPGEKRAIKPPYFDRRAVCAELS